MADMAEFASTLRLRRFIIPSEVRCTGKTIGKGAYGIVEELEFNGLICAGKKIYDILIDQENQGASRIVRKYYEECQLMSDLKHPNLVQFLGLSYLEDSSLPYIVMECLLTNLHDLLLGNRDASFFLELKRSILGDVARGLVYLHKRTPSVIHRDLTARNVLLNKAMVAKISDLGNARIVNFQPGQLAQTLSLNPGTAIYMPPEAMARYGPSLDIFSFGHLALFTVIQVFPLSLLPSTYINPGNPSVIPRTEIERRQVYIEMLYHQLGEKSPVVVLIKQCLENDPSRRPCAEEILHELEGMKVLTEDCYDHDTKLDALRMMKQKNSEIQQLQEQVASLRADVEAREAQIRQQGAEIQQNQFDMDRLMEEKMSLQLQLQEAQQQDTMHSVDVTQQGEVHLQTEQYGTEMSSSLCHGCQSRDEIIKARDEEISVKNVNISRLLKDLNAEMKKTLGSRDMGVIQTRYTRFFHTDVEAALETLEENKKWDARKFLCQVFQRIFDLLRQKILLTAQSSLDALLTDGPTTDITSLSDKKWLKDVTTGYVSLLSACGFTSPSPSTDVQEELEDKIVNEFTEATIPLTYFKQYVNKASMLAWSLLTASSPVIVSCSPSGYDPDLHDKCHWNTQLGPDAVMEYCRPILLSSCLCTDCAYITGQVSNVKIEYCNNETTTDI